MFCPQAISHSQKGFPTLLCRNLTLQSAPISTALPDQGEQSRIVSVAAGRAVSLAVVMRETSALGLGQGMVQGLSALWLRNADPVGLGLVFSVPSKHPLFHFHFCF